MFRAKRKEVYVWALVAQVTLAYYRICAWDERPLFGLVTPQQTNSGTREGYICGIISLQIILKNVLFSFYSRILLVINHSELSSQ